MQLEYQPKDRVLVDGELFDIGERRSNRFGGAVYRLMPLDGRAPTRWLTPRLDRSKASIVDRRALHDLVHGFYARVRADPELGPIFEARLADRWEPHLEQMVRFWSSILLDERSFVGEPMSKHRALHEARPSHFARWLVLFQAQLAETFTVAVIPSIARRALSMARGLSTGRFGMPFDEAPGCS